MKRSYLILLAVIITAVILLPWHVQAEKLREFGNSRTIYVAQGQEFQITLPANHTTGYSWKMAQGTASQGVIQHLRTDYMALHDTRLGAPGKETWVFKGLNPGRTTISMEYTRTQGEPARKRTYNVIVGNPGSSESTCKCKEGKSCTCKASGKECK